MYAKINIVNTPTSEMDLQDNICTLLHIRSLEEGGKQICGRSVVGGSRFCVYL